MFENRNCIIFHVNELDRIDFNQVLETSTDTVRLSLDGTRTFVKWENTEPDFIENLTRSDGPYTYSEMLNILAGHDWTAKTE